jgi:hypothetical protein
MAVVQGIREKVHLPIYDAVFVEPGKQLRDVEELDNSGTLKFFVNVQKKSKLETNLQSASLLPHYNTFEARAMRVVISDLPPSFDDQDEDEKNKVTASSADAEDVEPFVEDEDGKEILVDDSGSVDTTTPANNKNEIIVELELTLIRLMELLREARADREQLTTIPVFDDGVTLSASDSTGKELVVDEDSVAEAGGLIFLSVRELESMISALEDERKIPPLEQIRPSDGAGNLISKIIFNTVTTLYVGEKIMIQMPTWFFPGGAGAYSEGARFVSHGEPSPMATFRFAEPIYIDKQQNFRVEIEVTDKNILTEIQRIYGPLNLWVVLDGYMVRDVQ